MRLSNSHRPHRTISLTPLIDVVFLLLVFFMLASTFMKFTSVPISAAGSGTSSGTAEPKSIVLIHIGQDARLSVNGETIAANGLEIHLRRQLASGRQRAFIAIRPGATVTDLTRVLTIARRVSFSSTQVID